MKPFLFSVDNEGSTGGMLRVSHQSSLYRALVRGFTGQITDASFSNTSRNNILLAAVDETGTVLVHQIEIVDNTDIEYPFLCVSE